MLLWALPFILKNILRQKNNYGNSNISPCKNQGCQNWCDAAILHPTSCQHPFWRIGHVCQSECKKFFIDIWAALVINATENGFQSPILWLFFIANPVVIEICLVAPLCYNQNFSIATKGGCVIFSRKPLLNMSHVFEKLSTRAFQKHMTHPPFVVTKRFQSP